MNNKFDVVNIPDVDLYDCADQIPAEHTKEFCCNGHLVEIKLGKYTGGDLPHYAYIDGKLDNCQGTFLEAAQSAIDNIVFTEKLKT